MINRIKNIIITGHYEIKFVKSFRGFSNTPIKGFIMPENDIILINQNLNDQEKITTIIHEFIHEIEPNWSEHQVEKTCLKLYKQLNQPDYHFFLSLIR
ncbi:MAG TPA: hypothetical protein PLH65_01850 [bacterium]|nr:hypothetical protein [bacterium]